VIAGKRGWLAEPIYAAVQRLKLSDQVQFLDFVSDDDLPTLYSGALAMVYPSLYEGFGVPIVEAQACGAPVITSAASSLPEVAGEAALLVDPQDTAAIAAALRRVLSEPGLAERLRADGPRQAAKFTWEGTGLGILALYEKVGAKGKG
jgi:glycosyltransferase involved in cell wall biosynthesis